MNISRVGYTCYTSANSGLIINGTVSWVTKMLHITSKRTVHNGTFCECKSMFIIQNTFKENGNMSGRKINNKGSKALCNYSHFSSSETKRGTEVGNITEEVESLN